MAFSRLKSVFQENGYFTKFPLVYVYILAFLVCVSLVPVRVYGKSALSSSKKIPVILDTDIGDDIDDTWALVMLLKSPEFDIKMVIGDNHNGIYRAKLIAKMLEIAGRTDIPVGMAYSERQQGGRQSDWVKDYDLKSYPGKIYRDGVGAMIDIIKKSPEEITVLAIGPVPNLAEALKRDPSIVENSRFVGMHGSVYLGYDGSKEIDAEFNVRMDIKACQKVFTAPWDMVITPLDTCGLVRLAGEKYAKIRNSNDPVTKALVENYRIWKSKKSNEPIRTDEVTSSILFDTVAIYLAFEDELCKMETLPIFVDDEGYTRVKEGAKKMKVATKWKDMDKFEDLLAARIVAPVVKPCLLNKRDRYLVLDSRIIESTENMQLTVGTVQKDENNPLFKEDKPWEPRFDNPYCSIIFDEEEKIYKCWYSIFIKVGPEGDNLGEAIPSDKRAWVDWEEGFRDYGVCYATSKDGIHWDKPELGLIEYNGSKKNNIVIVFNHGVTVMKDLHETDPQKRYKAFHPESENSAVWFSPDGIHWGEAINVGPIDNGDTNNCVWWDEDLGKYVAITRHWGGAKTTGIYGSMGHRHVSRVDSDDFLNWSKPEIVIKGLDLRMQIHDMPVVKHAGVYLGMVGLFDIEASRQWCELAWSTDSIEWHRIQPGTPLIPNGPVMGDYDWGCIFTAKPLISKDKIRLYYGANDGRFMGWRNGYLALAWLRADGFAGYEQIEGGRNKTGSIITKPVFVIDDSLCISADVAPSGYVKVTALDENDKKLAQGELITKTVTDAPVQWKDGFSLRKLEGKEIKLKFELRESKLYSFSFK